MLTRSTAQDRTLLLPASCNPFDRPATWTKNSDPEFMAAEKQQFRDEQRQRNAVEGKIGQGKSRLGLGLIREKLAVTQGSTIALTVLVMNLEKPLEFLFVLISSWLQLHLCIQPGKGLRFVCLTTQFSPI